MKLTHFFNNCQNNILLSIKIEPVLKTSEENITIFTNNFSLFISAGEYVFCFSNEFSSISHKTVYFDFNHGNEDSLAPAGIGSHHTALTQIETSSVQIHESLNVIIDYQTHHRLREATSRDNAEYLNERVQYWSIGQAVIIVTVSLVQVLVLKNFFAEKRDRI